DVLDTKGQDSTLTLPIAYPPQTRPAVSNVSAVIGAGATTTVNFTVFHQGTTPTTAEVLFRDPSLDRTQPTVLNALAAPVCVRPIPPGPIDQTSWSVQLTCPTPGQAFAQVIVIPFDQTGPGQAARGPVAIP
ncbi:MAG TPA: hypothetical protein VKA84_15925, partial [Gemmatimonadaceae bacterium]|nr:hypothetical protein [Gemmatimonadaceae bacterium]